MKKKREYSIVITSTICGQGGEWFVGGFVRIRTLAHASFLVETIINSRGRYEVDGLYQWLSAISRASAGSVKLPAGGVICTASQSRWETRSGVLLFMRLNCPLESRIRVKGDCCGTRTRDLKQSSSIFK